MFGSAILDVQRANLDEVSHLYQANGKVLAIAIAMLHNQETLDFVSDDE